MLVNIEKQEFKDAMKNLQDEKQKLLERTDKNTRESEYEKQRKQKMKQIKEYNTNVIKSKYEFIIRGNEKCSKAEREQNLRDYNRKIEMEQGILKQFGQLDGCMEQCDIIQ